MSRPKRPVCSETGKERLREPKAAKVAVRAARRQRGHAASTGGRATWTVDRCYYCSACDGWHLTSQPQYS